MKSRTKLIATIMAICLVVTLGVFGILAVKTLNMSVGGNITFSAEGVSLIVSPGEFKTTDNKDYSNILTQTGKLQGFTMTTDTKLSDIQDKINSWAGLELVMDSKGDAVLHFSVKNTMSSPLYVDIATTITENTNDNMTMTVAPDIIEIAAGVTTNFTVTFDVLDTSINAGLKGFNVKIDFSKTQIDSEPDIVQEEILEYTQYSAAWQFTKNELTAEEDDYVATFNSDKHVSGEDLVIPSKIKINNVVHTISVFDAYNHTLTIDEGSLIIPYGITVVKNIAICGNIKDIQMSKSVKKLENFTVHYESEYDGLSIFALSEKSNGMEFDSCSFGIMTIANTCSNINLSFKDCEIDMLYINLNSIPNGLTFDNVLASFLYVPTASVSNYQNSIGYDTLYVVEEIIGYNFS